MKILRKSVRLKEMRKFVLRMNLWIDPLILLVILIMWLVPIKLVKLICAFFVGSMILTILAMSIGMYCLERKEILESLKLLDNKSDKYYRKIIFGNENECLFTMVIPITSATALWEFNEKYGFMDVFKWNALYGMLFNEKITNEVAYIVSFKLNEQEVDLKMLNKEYFHENNVYYMF